VAARVEGGELRSGGDWCATVPAGTVRSQDCGSWAARERGGRPGALPTAEQEGRDFLLNSCLIRLIYLLSLYREVYLLPSKAYLPLSKQPLSLINPNTNGLYNQPRPNRPLTYSNT
jgi:hypothetical protein